MKAVEDDKYVKLLSTITAVDEFALLLQKIGTNTVVGETSTLSLENFCCE